LTSSIMLGLLKIQLLHLKFLKDTKISWDYPFKGLTVTCWPMAELHIFPHGDFHLFNYLSKMVILNAIADPQSKFPQFCKNLRYFLRSSWHDEYRKYAYDLLKNTEFQHFYVTNTFGWFK
jgi:hypothetical protein